MQTHEELEAGTYYQFDTYLLDRDARTLRCAGRLVELTPKVFTTLLVLVENRDRVLTKDELLTLIWPDQFVDQSNLSQNISVLRRSLGEAETGKKYIATFPGRGYRFVGSVEVRQRDADRGAISSAGPAAPAGETVLAVAAQDRFSPPSVRPKSVRIPWNPRSVVRACVLAMAVIAAFAIGMEMRRARPSPPAGNGPVKVYARMDAGLTQPAWSRDGSKLAFVAVDLSGGQSSLYVQSRGDLQPHKLLSDSGQFSSPAWSPDGRQLAFLHFAPDAADLVLYDTQSRTSRILTKLFAHRYGLNYRHLDWSPDGKFVVVDDKNQDSEPFSLYLIYLASGQRVRLTYPDSDMIGDISPSVSPDGASVAFVRDIDHFEQDVYVTSVRGRTYRRITAAHTLISDVGWETDKALAFAADYGKGFRFWRVDLAKQPAQPALASRVDSERALQFSVAQRGRWVAFSNYAPNLEIWSLDLRKPSNRWVSVVQAPGESIRPELSPNGKLLAFLSNASGQFQIWVSGVDGTSAWPVSTGVLVPASFCWSFDGKALIFSPQHVPGLYEVPLHGDSAVREISSVYTDPRAARDGKSLFARAHFFLYRVPLRGGNAQEMTEQGGAPIAQSADGRYLYFPQGRMSTTIARLDLQTGHQEELIHALLPGYSDTWALSSGGIFFLGQEYDQPGIRFFNFATGGEEHVADLPGELPPVEMSGFGISPDGKSIWAVRADPMPSDIEITSLPPN
ncbi:MAG: winged helix-turn-helix domain-containing protein [Acidobacteriota bacterium]